VAGWAAEPVRAWLRKISGPEREEVAEWTKLHNEELHNVCSPTYYFGDQIKEYEMGGACSAHGRDEKCVQNVGQKA
jgi:hypothetical protein